MKKVTVTYLPPGPEVAWLNFQEHQDDERVPREGGPDRWRQGRSGAYYESRGSVAASLRDLTTRVREELEL